MWKYTRYGCFSFVGAAVVSMIIGSIDQLDFAIQTLSIIVLCTGTLAAFFLPKHLHKKEVEKIKEKEKEAIEAINKKLDGLTDFSITKKTIEPWGFIAIDEEKQKIILQEGEKESKTYPFSAILSCKIIEDKNVNYEVSGSTGALAGGLLAGTTGAIIGGMDKTQKESIEIKKISLKVVFKDISNPNYLISFFDAKKETEKIFEDVGKESIKLSYKKYIPILEKVFTQINEWKDTLEVIIEKNATTQKKNFFPSQETSPKNSVTQDLIKLNEMREKGIITDKEFQQQKKNLLG